MKKQFSKEEIRDSLTKFFETRSEVLLAYIFGSLAEGKQNRLSDVDIAILVKRGKLKKLDQQKFGYQVSVMTDLMGVLHRSDIDVVILNRATPLLAHEVVKYGELVFCRDKDARVEFEIRTRHRYLDTKYLREIQDAYFSQRVKEGRIGRVKNG